jgi:hypothetical protein
MRPWRALIPTSRSVDPWPSRRVELEGVEDGCRRVHRQLERGALGAVIKIARVRADPPGRSRR